MRSFHPAATGISFFSPDFFLSIPPWLIYEQTQVVTRSELMTLKGVPNSRAWHSFHYDVYQNAFKQLIQAIEADEIKKAVPYAWIESEGEVVLQERIQLLLDGLETWGKRSFGALYGSWDDYEGNLGVTPELLFKLDSEGHVHTMALAGTVPLSAIDELETNAKLNHEHDYVISGIEHVWEPYGTVKRGTRQVVTLPLLAHLLTPLELIPDAPLSFEQLVQVLHPTPALGTHPKEKGFQWLKDYDTLLPRGRFGAPFGYYDSDRQTGSCYVSIRQVDWDQSKMRIAAGGGIVKDSELDTEWQELQLKWAAIKEGFKL